MNSQISWPLPPLSSVYVLSACRLDSFTITTAQLIQPSCCFHHLPLKSTHPCVNGFVCVNECVSVWTLTAVTSICWNIYKLCFEQFSQWLYFDDKRCAVLSENEFFINRIRSLIEWIMFQIELHIKNPNELYYFIHFCVYSLNEYLW